MELVHTSSSSWPLLSPSSTSSTSKPLRITILDSSFNPPHLAHLALAAPPSSTSAAHDHAFLLLLSTQNVDKVPKHGDASVEQRLEMMHLLGRELQSGGRSVAVGKCKEATFTGKERVVREWLAAKVESERSWELCFCLGWDTLIRLFAPKYYQPPSPSMLDSLTQLFTTSTVACARRGDVSQAEEDKFLNQEEVRGWIDRIELYDLKDERLRECSSTLVRKTMSIEDSEERKRKLGELVPSSIAQLIERDGLYYK